MSWCDLDLTFDLTVLTLTYCPGYILESVRYRKLMLGRYISWGLEVCNITV